MSRYFEHDLESDKLHIHTGGKSEWMSLPNDKRDEVKRFCLWSKSRECWISKAARDRAYWLLKTLAELGFEDRGQVGEKLTLPEKIEAKQERAEARAERMEDRAIAAENRSNSLAKQSHDMMSVIPMGQPILVGHYSERRDRNYRDRAWNKMGASVKEGEKAEYYARRATTARATASGAEYSDPAYLGNRIKERESNIRLIEQRMQGKYYHYSEPKPVSDELLESYQAKLDEEREELAFFQHCLDTCGKTVYNRESLKGMAAVKIRGRWEEIVKLNPTTVATPNICFPNPESQRKWALKYLYSEVQDAR